MPPAARLGVFAVGDQDVKLNPEDPSTWGPLLEVTQEYGVDPFVPIESEAFFTALFESYKGPEDDEAGADGLHGERPNWIQGPNWPFHDGRTMVLAGQLDVPGNNSNAASFYHDDTSLDVFIAPHAEPLVIIQQY